MKESKIDKTLFHRLFLLFIILFLPLFLIKEYKIINSKKNAKLSLLPPAQSQPIDIQDKQFTLIILTKNNITTIKRNFESIIKQKYPHYQTIYIDRASTDGTPGLLKQLIDQKGQSEKIRLIEAQKNYKAVQFYFEQIHALDNHQVVIHLSGLDFLAHDEVLDLVNKTYENPDVWMTYGQHLDDYYYQKGIYQPEPQKLILKKRAQRAPWISSSFKTFYAGHFKRVKRGNPKEIDFLSFDSEASLLSPLAELGKAHIQFIPNILYIRGSHQPPESRKIKPFFRQKKINKTLFDSLEKKSGGS